MNAYRTLCTQFYDLDKPAAPPDALAFYLAHAQAAAGPVLEPMCGSGRFLAPLLERGIDIDGTDASPQMLAPCAARCERIGHKPLLLQQLLHELNLPRQYALAFIPAGSFQLITDPNQARAALRRIYDHLLPNGRLLLELSRKRSEESSSWPWGGRWVDRPDDARIIISWLGSYDAATHVSRSVNRYDLVRDGRLLETEFEDFDLRHYVPEEVKDLLTKVGFRDVHELKAYGDGPPDEGDDDAVFEASKPG